MTRDEKDRLTALEVRMDGHGKILEDISKDVKAVRDAMLVGQGAEAVRKHNSTWFITAITALSSIFGGGVGAILTKKFG